MHVRRSCGSGRAVRLFLGCCCVALQLHASPHAANDAPDQHDDVHRTPAATTRGRARPRAIPGMPDQGRRPSSDSSRSHGTHDTHGTTTTTGAPTHSARATAPPSSQSHDDLLVVTCRLLQALLSSAAGDCKNGTHCINTGPPSPAAAERDAASLSAAGSWYARMRRVNPF